MREPLNESAIVRAVAEEAAERLTRKVITKLQRMDYILSGDDSELKTIWDEICVQIQYDESFFWDAYDETLRNLLLAHVSDLARYELEAIWLQTDAGRDWILDDPDERRADPVLEEDIINFLAREFVYKEAGEWSNARIRAYIERAAMRD